MELLILWLLLIVYIWAMAYILDVKIIDVKEQLKNIDKKLDDIHAKLEDYEADGDTD